MKTLFRIPLAALALLLMMAFRPQTLPTLEKADVLTFFKALPKSDLPERLSSPEAREAYFNKFRFMVEEGALGDGEGPEETARKLDHALFWSDYLDYAEDITDEPYQSEDVPHPYLNLYVYAGSEKGKQFGVIRSGAYVDGEDHRNPDKCYWLDTASGRLNPTALPLDPPYTVEDLTANTLLTYGAPNLYYLIRDKRFIQVFHDGGMDVLIEEVGKSDVSYDWNGSRFVRNRTQPHYCLYNYSFAHFMLGEKVPFNVPEYTTKLVSSEGYEFCYYLVKDGEEEPTLIFRTDTDDNIFMIEVCSSAYCNPYGIHPGMLVTDFLKVVEGVDARFPEPSYISYNDADPDFVTIYTGIDEDFIYKVPKDQYKGDGKFVPGARIARVAVVNAVG